MTVEELNRLVDEAYAAAFAYETELETVYRKAFDRAAKQAAAKFKTTVVTAAGFVPPPVDTLTSGMTEKEQKQADDVRDKAAAAIAAALVALGLAAVSVSFLQAISARGSLNFDQELLRTLRTVVAKGLAEGWTADETAVAIQKAFTNVSSTTAQMLSQTELTTLVNERAMEAAQKTVGVSQDPLYKRWRTVGDNRVRAAHAHAEGQTVPVNQPFTVGGYAMNYPGDPAAPMRLVARCRCRLEFSNSLTASAQEANLMSTMEQPFAFDEEPVTAGLVVTIEEEDDEEMACPDCGAMNDAEAQMCDQCGCDMMAPEAESPEEDTGEGGVEEDMAEWTALLAIEGQPTEDGRLIDPGALSWRDLPLSLMAMDTTGPGGHEGAQVAGRIDRIWRDGNDIWGSGVFDTGDFGCKVKRMVAEQTLRGNSVDLAVTAFEYRNAAGDVLDMDGVMEAMMADEPVTMAVTEGVILASTVCPTPAIAGAEILIASGVVRMEMFFAPPEDTLTASAAGMAPLHPPAAWFDDPKLDKPTPLTVTKEGRVFGHAALWNSCHIGEPSGPGICVPPPRSGMAYEIFHHGACETAEGHDVSCGQITMSTLHAGRDLGWKATLEHYEHSGCAVADVQAHEDRFGIVVAGGLRPDLPAAKVRELKAGSLSGDWRQVIGKGLEFLAALVVNIPGFPIPRPEARIVASAFGDEEILALVAAGVVTPEDEQGMSRREYLRQVRVLTREA